MACSGGNDALFICLVSSVRPHMICVKTLDISSEDMTVMTCCHVLCVMGDIAAHLNEDTKLRLVGQ